MDVFEAIRTRRSIRRYESKAVEKEKLFKVLEAARLAPSAKNYQPWSFIVVTDSRIKNSLNDHLENFNRDWSISAPVIIVACAFPEKGYVRKDGEEYWRIDVSIAMQNLILAAWEEGLGTCWIAVFDEKKIKEVLGIPSNIRVIAMTTLGYPAEQKEPVTKRKTLDEIVHYDCW